MSTPDSTNPAPFLPQHEVFPKDDAEFLVKLTNLYTKIATATNSREIGTYDLQQLQDGQSWFNKADPTQLLSGFRRVYEVPAIAIGATAAIPHGITITSKTLFTHIWGTIVTNPVWYLPLPHVDPTNVLKQVSVYLNGTNIYVTNGANANPITSGIVVLEYVLG